MSTFNLLKNGAQFNSCENKIKKSIMIPDLKESSGSGNQHFPNCIKEKKMVSLLEKKILMVSQKKIKSPELKEKKLEILRKKLQIIKNNINDKLNLLSPQIEDIDPLCSFEEIQKKCKFRKSFSQIMKEKYKFSHPSPVQSAVIPILNSKRHILASSETGSGKTLAYLIPIIHNVFLNKLKNEELHNVLIILPTKELSKQIFNEALVFSSIYAEGTVKVKYLNKGMLESIKGNFDIFISNNDIVIATPKKALEILTLENKKFADKVLYLILDEADKFFDMGFIETIDEILFQMKDYHGAIKGFFSATLLEEIEEIITTNIFNSIKISIGSSSIPAKNIQQKFIYCTNEEGKLIGMRNLFKDGIEFPLLIFVEGIEKIKYIYETIKYDIPKTSVLHSRMSKQEREEIVKKLRIGQIWVSYIFTYITYTRF